MSHEATNWAIKQRGLRPATKLVLWHLCDRYHPDHGCFPSQTTLAEDCELSRSSLNDQLDSLETAGLIAREQRRKKGSMQRESTYYRFAFEAGFVRVSAEKPCPNSGQGYSDDGMSENAPEPSPKNAESHVRNSDSNPVREPVIEPVIEKNTGEGEGEKGQVDDESATTTRKAIERAYWRLIKVWPNVDGLPKDGWLNAWMALTADEREAAERLFPEWLKLLEKGGKGGRHTPRPSTYFHSKLWTEIPEKPADPPKPVDAAPFGKAGMASRLFEMFQPERPHPLPPMTVRMKIEAGGDAADDEIINRRGVYSWPRLVDLNRRISERLPLRVAPDVASFGEDFVPVEITSQVGQAWKRLFRRMKLPWLPVEPKYAYFPPISVNAVDLDDAVAKAFWMFKRRTEGDVDAAAE